LESPFSGRSFKCWEGGSKKKLKVNKSILSGKEKYESKKFENV